MISQQFFGNRLPDPGCAAEAEAVRNLGMRLSQICGARHHWTCTRALGHVGVHVAAGSRSYNGRSTPMVLERWTDT